MKHRKYPDRKEGDDGPGFTANFTTVQVLPDTFKNGEDLMLSNTYKRAWLNALAKRTNFDQVGKGSFGLG